VLLAEIEAAEEEDLAHVGLDVGFGASWVSLREPGKTGCEVEARHVLPLTSTTKRCGHATW
jgi:hypothetical protein